MGYLLGRYDSLSYLSLMSHSEWMQRMTDAELVRRLYSTTWAQVECIRSGMLRSAVEYRRMARATGTEILRRVAAGTWGADDGVLR